MARNQSKLALLTKNHIRNLFDPQDVDRAEYLLSRGWRQRMPQFDLERILFAVLRVSGGKIDKLIEAIKLAETDWRDILVCADFADDVEAHRNWISKRSK